MPLYRTVVTDAGRALIANALIGGTPVNITHMAVGDAAGLAFDPDPTMSELAGERYRAPLNTLTAVPGSTERLQGELLVPGNEGGFTARNVGLFTDDGLLVAVGSLPPIPIPLLADGAAVSAVVNMVVDFANTGDVTLVVEQVLGDATQAWGLASFAPIRETTREIPGTEHALSAVDEHARLVFNSDLDVFVTLPAQATTSLPQGLRTRLRNRGAGQIWLVPEEQGNEVEGAGNTTTDPAQEIALHLEVGGTPNRWVTSGKAVTTAPVPDPEAPPPSEPTMTGYSNDTLTGYDNQPLEYYEE